MHIRRFLLSHEVLARSPAALCDMPVRASSKGPGCYSIRATLEWYHDYVIWGYVMAILLLHYGYVVATAMAAASARREAVLQLPCQPGECKQVCSSYSSLSLLLGFWLMPCLPWFQRTVWTVWAARQLVLWAVSVIQCLRKRQFSIWKLDQGSFRYFKITFISKPY